MKNLFPLLLLLIMPACSWLSSNGEGVSARAGSGEVIIYNDSSAPVYYFVVGRNLAALIDWLQHLDPEQRVAPGAARRIDYDAISQEESGEEEAIVYWWHAELQAGEEKPGELHAIVVGLSEGVTAP